MRHPFFIACALSACLFACSGCSTGTKEPEIEAMTKQAQNTTQLLNAQTQDIEQEAVSRNIFAMDTYMTVTAYGENAEDAVLQAQERIEEIEAILSTGSAGSEISRLNEEGRGILSETSCDILENALKIWAETDGAFNPAIYPLMEIWGFPAKQYKVPQGDVIQRQVQLTDASQIAFNTHTGQVEFGMDGMKLDFGGIAKGYTSAEIMDIFKEHGVRSGMVSLGGNVQVLGSKADGSLWRVAIQDPDDESGYLGVLETQNKAVITSGGYERYFEEDGVIYHHILDPKTGYPARNGLKSVTIISEDGMLADGLSTALFVMGLEQAEQFWKSHSNEFDAVFLTDDGMLYVTEGIADTFFTENKMQIIEKDE